MLTLEKLVAADIVEIAAAFAKRGWSKPASQYEAYLAEQEAGERVGMTADYGKSALNDDSLGLYFTKALR